MIVRDSARVQGRIKAVFRSRGVSVVGKTVYSAGGRDEYAPPENRTKPWPPRPLTAGWFPLFQRENASGFKSTRR
jgi:hypothetical protein